MPGAALRDGPAPTSHCPRCPLGVGGVALDVALADKRGEPAPTPKFKAFAGSEGHALGGGAAAEEAKAKLVRTRAGVCFSCCLPFLPNRERHPSSVCLSCT
jgi:hypothetical protein